MSITKEENWDFLSRQHEYFLKNPSYLAWMEYSTRPEPLSPEDEKKWQEAVEEAKKKE